MASPGTETAPAAALPPPLDLPRLVMRRAAGVAATVLLLALVLGLARMGEDIEEELHSALTGAGLMARLATLDRLDDGAALAALQAVQQQAPLRHLTLAVHAADGRLLLGPPAAEPAAAPMRWLLGLHRRWLSAPEDRQVSWPVQRPGGAIWTVQLIASPESERQEAMASLIDMLLLLLVCVAGLLLVMRWNVRRAFAPMGRLLEAIARIEGQDGRAVQALPPMPIHELEILAAALRHLGAALTDADRRRRLLSQQVLTLQEDERARLAHELHDEFGQHLTALRVDAAWLTRQLSGQPELRRVAEAMGLQCQQVQQDIRALLTRLQPFGDARGDGAEHESLARGLALLRALVESWQSGGRGAHFASRLQLHWLNQAGEARPEPPEAVALALRLSGALWLTLYRISQEALTNAARHAEAGEVALSLVFQGDWHPGAPVEIVWQVVDDGIGLPDPAAVMARGNGLAGLQERIWAQGAHLAWAPLAADADRPGLRLSARFHTRWV